MPDKRRTTPQENIIRASVVFDLLGGKWTIPIVDVLKQKTLRYNALEKALPGITQRALTMVLRNLECNGVIERRAYPTIPPQVEYKLTLLGLELLKLCEIVSDWSEKHEAEIKRAQKTYAHRIKDMKPLL